MSFSRTLPYLILPLVLGACESSGQSTIAAQANSAEQAAHQMRDIKPTTQRIQPMTIPTSGTPITADNLVDVLEVQRVSNALTNAVDSQQWDVVRDILVDEVDTTIGETEPGVSRVKSDEDIVTRWRGFYDAAEKLVIHHVTSNERVFFGDPDNATVYSKGVIVVENTPAGEFAASDGMLRMHRWINYEIGLIRTAAGWKVNKVLVEYLVEEATSLPAPADGE